MFRKRKALAAIAIGFPVTPLIALVPVQQVAQNQLSPPECRVAKWELPVNSQNQLQNLTDQKSVTPPLVPIQQSPFPCCKDDISCLDNQLWGENNQLPDKKRC